MFNITNRRATPSKAIRQHGFSLPEVLVAASAGVVLIGASTLALRSTGSLINKMDQKAALQQNTTSGKKLMRAEIERSLHLLIKTDQAPNENLAHTNINHEDYQESLNQCNTLADESNKIFQPIFGVKMAELNQPVFYGLSTSNTGRGYSIQRCGAVMSLDGRYNETEQQTIATLKSSFEAKESRIYCLMWGNSSDQQVRLRYEFRARPLTASN